MNPKNPLSRFAPSLCLIVLALAGVTRAQNSTAGAPAACGKAKVKLDNPSYLTAPLGIVVVEPPPGWALDKTRKVPFYFFKRGETYQNARTLICINVELLDVALGRAVERDRESFEAGCRPSRISHVAKLQLLEQGCESQTELFRCDRKEKPYVDLATKIAIGGLLLNVVLSADTPSEISQYRSDYEFLLKHLTVVN